MENPCHVWLDFFSCLTLKELIVSLCVFRFQREVEAQSAETGDQQPSVWPAYPLPHVHRPEQAGRLGGGAEETAQVRHHCHVRDWNRCALRPCGHVNIIRLITCSKLLLSFVHGTVHIFPCPRFSLEVAFDMLIIDCH